MIQKVSVNSLDKNKYTPSNVKHNDKTSFTGFGSAVVDAAIKGMQKCEAEPMLNVTVLDLSTAIVPRSVIETVASSKQKDENGNVIKDENGKTKRKFNFLAGLEALRRESSGLIINCILPSFIVIGVAKCLSGHIMGPISNLTKNWADKDTLSTINTFYKGQGAENYAKTLKNMFLDLKGADGNTIDKSFAEIYKQSPEEFDKIFTHLGQMADSKDLDRKAVRKAIHNIVDKTHISENIKFITNNEKGNYFGNSLEALLRNTVEVLHDSKNVGINSASEFSKYIEKAQKLVKWKSLGGMALILPLALAAQPINRWITHQSAGGKKGAPIYNDNADHSLTKQEKAQLLKQKFVSIGSMISLSLLSMMKMPSMKMLEFRNLFPSMDQARIISTATFASRMGASEDFNDLRESTVRDLATFASFYFLGDYAAKGIATFIEHRNKKQIAKAIANGTTPPKEVKLINVLKPLKENANSFEKFWHWTKHTALKSTSEISSKHVENLRSACQLGNLGFSLLSLGLFIPLIGRIQTNKKEQVKKELAKATQNAATANTLTNSPRPPQTSATQASTSPTTKSASTTGTQTATNSDNSKGRLKPTDKNSAAFGAFFNS